MKTFPQSTVGKLMEKSPYGPCADKRTKAVKLSGLLNESENNKIS